MDNVYKSKITFRVFVNEIADKKIKKEIQVAGIIGYILAALNLIISLFMNPYGIIDAVLIAGFSLGMHLEKSRICALLFLIYGVINFIIATAQQGKPAGHLILIIGICAIREFYIAHKQYKAYTNITTF